MTFPQPYPLYDDLLRQYEDLTDEGLNLGVAVSIINGIKIKNTKEVTQQHYEEIVALILHHWLLEHGSLEEETFPYPHKVMYQGNGLTLNLGDFPPLLQGIISLYVQRIPEIRSE